MDQLVSQMWLEIGGLWVRYIGMEVWDQSLKIGGLSVRYIGGDYQQNAPDPQNFGAGPNPIFPAFNNNSETSFLVKHLIYYYLSNKGQPLLARRYAYHARICNPPNPPNQEAIEAFLQVAVTSETEEIALSMAEPQHLLFHQQNEAPPAPHAPASPPHQANPLNQAGQNPNSFALHNYNGDGHPYHPYPQAVYHPPPHQAYHPNASNAQYFGAGLNHNFTGFNDNGHQVAAAAATADAEGAFNNNNGNLYRVEAEDGSG